MLKTRLLHPEILAALGSAGHGSKVLIADGNYSFGSSANPAATRVFLNLAPGLVTVTDVLQILSEAIPIEAVEVMMPASGEEPSIYNDFRHLLSGMEMQRLGRFEFYEVARQRETILVIATGEQRIYANILLTIGVVMPE